jgi:hypothetical protein
VGDSITFQIRLVLKDGNHVKAFLNEITAVALKRT